MTALTLQNLTIKHQETILVDGVSLAIGAGKTLCLVGESGSGKTLTGLAIMGLLPPTLTVSQKGITLGETDLGVLTAEELRSQRGKNIGMIFQEPMTALNPVMTVGKQLDEVLLTHTDMPKTARKDKILTWLDKVKLPDPERMYRSFPHQLSGGQRQRICIAMALLLEPKLLIADEPTTALDVTVQQEILHLIQQLQADMGLTVLFITHDFGVVRKIGHEVAVLEHGKLREMGDVNTVLNSPKHAYTKKLLAAIPTLTSKKKKRTLSENAPLLSVKNLNTTFKTSGGFFKSANVVHAVKNAELTLRAGEVLGIVGESGSGKSTLVRTIAGLTPKASGEVIFHETNASESTSLQMVFQDPFSSLNPRLTIGQNIKEGLRANTHLNIENPQEYINNLLEECGLPKGASARYPHQFSGGQRQRVCIARALALKPQIILADEATSALDVSIQKQILELLQKLKETYNIAFIFISHDLRVVSQFSDNIIVMKDGAIVEHGTTSSVIGAPKNAYTQQLLTAAA